MNIHIVHQDANKHVDVASSRDGDFQELKNFRHGERMFIRVAIHNRIFWIAALRARNDE